METAILNKLLQTKAASCCYTIPKMPLASCLVARVLDKFKPDSICSDLIVCAESVLKY